MPREIDGKSGYEWMDMRVHVGGVAIRIIVVVIVHVIGRRSVVVIVMLDVSDRSVMVVIPVPEGQARTSIWGLA